MSVIHDMLNDVEVKEKVQTTPWAKKETRNNGLFVFDLPNEILNDFYDLKEYIRIANKQGDMRVLSIASASSGEGSSTIATYLSFLMSGGMAKKLEIQFANEEIAKQKEMNDNKNDQMIFNDEFSALVTEEYSEIDGLNGTSVQDMIDPDEDILLVDANLNQPSLHKYFGVEVKNGLADIVANNLNWRPFAKPVHDSKLRFITAGISQTNPVELLSSPAFYDLVAEWRETFKYVIFDSSPVLQFVDSMSLASVVDGVVLVVRAGQTRWELAQHAKRKLANANAHLLGVALNRRKMDIPEGLYKRLMV